MIVPVLYYGEQDGRVEEVVGHSYEPVQWTHNGIENIHPQHDRRHARDDAGQIERRSEDRNAADLLVEKDGQAQ